MSDLNRKFSIIGGGGLGFEILGYLLDVYKGSSLRLRVWDDTPPQGPLYTDAWRYEGALPDIQVADDEEVLICIGNCDARTRIAELLRGKGVNLGKFIHPSAVIASSAKVQPGSIILPFSCVSFDSSIGHNTLINSHVAVGHHAKIAENCVLSPQCLVAGGALIGPGTFVGGGVVIGQGVVIGAGSTVAAGSVVYRSSDDRAFLTGNPAKNIYRKRRDDRET
jgi:sugar O-acyltransferase (sialic acid O-acetyltransferase NeuD family)